jgi:exodeoxyribonuclease V alpha subunit
MKEIIVNSELLNNIDIVFADYITASCNSDNTGNLWILSAFLSWSSNNGNTAFDLNSVSGKSLQEIFGNISKSTFNEIKHLTLPELKADELCTSYPEIIGKPGEYKPLIYDGSLFALHKFYMFEKKVAEFIIGKVQKENSPDNETIRELNRLFPDNSTPNGKINYQKVAALLALRKNFLLISGGPGTGKTTTVGNIITLLLKADNNTKIKLLAPTGKAADRLNESIRIYKQTSENKVDKTILNSIEENAETIHRFLGINSYKLRYDSANPAPYNVLVVDEASMIPLPNFYLLFNAVHDECKIILMGDKDQLTAVENGDVLNDLTKVSHINEFSSKFTDFAAEATDGKINLNQTQNDNILNDLTVQLEYSWRFSENSGIALLSSIVNNITSPSETDKVFNILKSSEFSDIKYHNLETEEKFHNFLNNEIITNFETYKNAVENNNIELAFNAITDYKILCALNKTAYGVKEINPLIEKTLFRKNSGHLFYHGKPVMIIENDYRLGLFNGDIGIIFHNNNTGNLEVYFKDSGEKSDSFKTFSPYSLNGFITAFAVTIHKSQGSEFNNVLIILPPDDNRILSKELIYTAVTRAKKSCTIVGSEEIISQAVIRNFSRTSGLKDKLLNNTL